MKKTDFLKMHCVNTDDEFCKICPRDFSLNVSAVATISKNGNDNAVIQTAEHSFFHPLCGKQSRSIKTNITYEEVMALLDGGVEDIGSVKMTYYKDAI